MPCWLLSWAWYRTPGTGRQDETNVANQTVISKVMASGFSLTGEFNPGAAAAALRSTLTTGDDASDEAAPSITGWTGRALNKVWSGSAGLQTDAVVFTDVDSRPFTDVYEVDDTTGEYAGAIAPATDTRVQFTWDGPSNPNINNYDRSNTEAGCWRIRTKIREVTPALAVATSAVLPRVALCPETATEMLLLLMPACGHSSLLPAPGFQIGWPLACG